MTLLQKLIGRIFPPYKFKVQRQEWTVIVDSLINALPDDFGDLKEQRRSTRLYNLSDWEAVPGFRFMTIGYSDAALKAFVKRGQNYKLSGQRIFSVKADRYVNVEFILRDNCLTGLSIEQSNYELQEFDLNRIENKNLQKTPVDLPPTDIDLFYAQLHDDIKSKLSPGDIFEIDFDNRTYFAFYDLEDGNYLATDKKMHVYSLVHDARPQMQKLKTSLPDILANIEAKTFDKVRHLAERHKGST
jgi:hypothetical protein